MAGVPSPATLKAADRYEKRRRPVRNTTAASEVLKNTSLTREADMFRALAILAAVVALAVSAAPAPAGTSKAPSTGTAQGRVGGKMHLEDISLGIISDKSLPRLVP
jgi:hypothetical protein